MLVYKFDILQRLKEAGYSSYRIRQENIFAQGTLTKFRNNIIVAPENIDTLCALLNCQPGDILEYIED